MSAAPVESDEAAPDPLEVTGAEIDVVLYEAKATTERPSACCSRT